MIYNHFTCIIIGTAVCTYYTVINYSPCCWLNHYNNNIITNLFNHEIPEIAIVSFCNTSLKRRVQLVAPICSHIPRSFTYIHKHNAML